MDQPLSIPTISPAASPTTAGQIQIGVIGKNLVVQVPRELGPYSQYFENLKGVYNPANSTWSFYKNKEVQVRSLLTDILTGRLPPPNMLVVPTAQEISIDISGAGVLPVTAPLVGPVVVTTEIPFVPPEKVKARRTKKIEETRVILPSQAIVESIQLANIPPIPPSGTPSLVPPPEPRQLPQYNPLEKEPGESQAEFQRRVQLYTYLTSLVLPTKQNIPSGIADVLSRMRNAVDIDGVGYNPISMQTLNTYLKVN